MLVQSQFREDDPAFVLEEIRKQGTATLVSHGPDGLVGTLVPLEFVSEPSPWGRVRCHLVRANPHADVLAACGDVMLIFQGAQGYISPSYYPTKQTNEGKVVPTWAYVAIHAYGTATVFEGPEALRPHVSALSDHFEAGREAPWAVTDAPDDFIDMLCKAIIGFEITLTRVDAKWKMNQHRPPADREGMVEGLKADGYNDLADIAEAAIQRRREG